MYSLRDVGFICFTFGHCKQWQRQRPLTSAVLLLIWLFFVVVFNSFNEGIYYVVWHNLIPFCAVHQWFHLLLMFSSPGENVATKLSIVLIVLAVGGGKKCTGYTGSGGRTTADRSRSALRSCQTKNSFLLNTCFHATFLPVHLILITSRSFYCNCLLPPPPLRSHGAVSCSGRSKISSEIW
jgi:hypothetical protein